ncbi:MAG: hypothetical protein EOP04_04335 [Proteobacteria bacterium]|nr:MAG: hypothetical protein EOP04_04335 [Pseudomonadota bacterium]
MDWIEKTIKSGGTEYENVYLHWKLEFLWETNEPFGMEWLRKFEDLAIKVENEKALKEVRQAISFVLLKQTSSYNL